MASRPAKQRRSTIAVELHSFRRYRPGSGPTLQPVTLVPRRDSTAYIVTKLVTPVGIEIGLEVQRRMNYVIGWRDFPAARATVPATHILDYVSPAELEEWEYRELLSREDEERKRAEEGTKIGVSTKPIGRPRARPPTARLAAQPVGTPELSASEEALIAHKKASGPSLSTPKKRTLHELMHAEHHVEETGDSEDSDDTAIMRQLQSESVTQGTFEDEVKGEESDVGMVDIDGGAVERMQELGRPIITPGDDTSRSSSLMAAAASASGQPAASGKARRKMDTGKDEDRRKRPTKALKKEFSSPPPSSVSLPTTSQIPPLKPSTRKETYIPPPNIPPSRGPSSSRPHSKERTASSTNMYPMFTKPLGASQTLPNTAPLVHPAFSEQNRTLEASTASSSTKRRADPTLFPRQEKINSGGSRMAIPASSKTSRSKNGSTGTPSRSTSFTPAGCSPQIPKTKSQVVSSTPIPLPEIQAPKSTTKKSATKRTAKPASSPKEEVWEVKTLLDERRRYDDNNRLIHEFKVLWAGNWPPDQNPTWEPERNVPKTLINEYQKKKASQGKNQRTLLSYMPKRRFSNVAEAFAGDLGEDDELRGANEHDEDKDEDDDVLEIGW